MLLTSFFGVVMHRHNVIRHTVIKAVSIAATVARRRQLAILAPSTFQWLL